MEIQNLKIENIQGYIRSNFKKENSSVSFEAIMSLLSSMEPKSTKQESDKEKNVLVESSTDDLIPINKPAEEPKRAIIEFDQCNTIDMFALSVLPQYPIPVDTLDNEKSVPSNTQSNSNRELRVEGNIDIQVASIISTDKHHIAQPMITDITSTNIPASETDAKQIEISDSTKIETNDLVQELSIQPKLNSFATTMSSYDTSVDGSKDIAPQMNVPSNNDLKSVHLNERVSYKSSMSVHNPKMALRENVIQETNRSIRVINKGTSNDATNARVINQSSVFNKEIVDIEIQNNVLQVLKPIEQASKITQVTELTKVSKPMEENKQVLNVYSLDDIQVDNPVVASESKKVDADNKKLGQNIDQLIGMKEKVRKPIPSQQNDKTHSLPIEASNIARTIISNKFGEVSDIEAKGKLIKTELITKQVTQGITEGITNGKTEIVIKLVPDGLGQVTVKMSYVEGKMQLSILSNNESTSVLLSSQVNELRTALSTNQVEVSNILMNGQSTNNSFASYNGFNAFGSNTNQHNQSHDNKFYTYEPFRNSDNLEAKETVIRPDGRILNYTA